MICNLIPIQPDDFFKNFKEALDTYINEYCMNDASDSKLDSDQESKLTIKEDMQFLESIAAKTPKDICLRLFDIVLTEDETSHKTSCEYILDNFCSSEHKEYILKISFHFDLMLAVSLLEINKQTFLSSLTQLYIYISLNVDLEIDNYEFHEVYDSLYSQLPDNETIPESFVSDADLPLYKVFFNAILEKPEISIDNLVFFQNFQEIYFYLESEANVESKEYINTELDNYLDTLPEEKKFLAKSLKALFFYKTLELESF